MSVPSLPARIPPARRSFLVFFAGFGVMFAVVGWGLIRFQRVKESALPASERTMAELTRREGVLWENSGQRPFTGWLVQRYQGGGLQSRSWISNGILGGVSEGWHTNGVLQIREHFVAGAGEGPATRWRDDGSKLSEGVAKQGKLEGVFRRWHSNGQLAEEVNLKAGEPEGLSRAWFPSGCLKAEVRLTGGKVISQQFWKDGETQVPSLVATPGVRRASP